MKTESALTGMNAGHQSLLSGLTVFGLRREVKRHAALEGSNDTRKAVSPLRSANAVQIFASLLLCVFALMPPALGAATNDLSGLLQKGLFEEEANRNLEAAAQAYSTVSAQFDKDRKLAATAIFRLGEIYRKQGKTNEAAGQYERIVREFADQDTLVTLSRQNIAGLGTQHSATAIEEPSALNQSAAEARMLNQLKKLSRTELRSVLPVVVNDPTLTELLTEINAADAKIAETKNDFGPTHPQRQRLESLREALNEAIEKQLDAIMKGMELRVTAAIGAPSISQKHANAPTTIAPDDEEKEIRRIQVMIQNSPDLINAPSEGTLTPLCRAVSQGQLRVATFLLDHGAAVNQPSGQISGLVRQGTPLHYAAENGHKAVVEFLLQRGAEVDAREQQNGYTALHTSTSKGFQAVAEALVAGKADANARSKTQTTPLHLTAVSGHPALAAFLIGKGANVDAHDDSGQTAVVIASARGQLDILNKLIAAKANLNLPDKKGCTALFYAASNGQVECVKALLAAGADPNVSSSESEGGVTALHVAAARASQESVKVLLEHGAKPNVTALFGQPGVTPLMVAASTKDPELVALLLKYKADPNLADAKGNTALLNAVFRQSPEVVRPLLAGGANPDTKSASGYPALVVAVGDAPSKEVAAALLEAKADVNAPDLQGSTPLHWAVSRNRRDLAELLIKAGADINRRDKSGGTPLVYAKQVNAPDYDAFAAWLRQHGALDDLPAFDRIQIKRPAANFSKTIFSKGKNDGQQFTLFELLAVQYQFLAAVPGGERGSREDTQLLAMNDHRSDALPFPDLAHVRLRRPAPDAKSWEEQVLDVGALLRSGDCAKDMPLHWGDEVVIPETDHPLNATWNGFSRAELKTLDICLTRKVEIIVKGQSTKITVGPKFEYLNLGNSPYVVTKAPVWIQPVLRGSNLLLSSSDLARVKVTRRDTATGQAREWTLDCSKPDNAPDLWLRDGDVIEVPDKP